jgi:hypothetical protein
MEKSQQWQWIPTQLSLVQFEQFVLPHLVEGRRGPSPKLSLHAIFNYILRLLYLSVEGAADCHQPGRLSGSALHAHLPDVPVLAGAGLP